jgi:hypothetical protein
MRIDKKQRSQESGDGIQEKRHRARGKAQGFTLEAVLRDAEMGRDGGAGEKDRGQRTVFRNATLEAMPGN